MMSDLMECMSDLSPGSAPHLNLITFSRICMGKNPGRKLGRLNIGL